MQNLTYKILEKHLLKGKLEAGQPIEIKMDQTLTQDATGTMAYMQFEAMGVKKVKTELSVSYVDHNTLQNGFMNADDHAYLQSVISTVRTRSGADTMKARPGATHMDTIWKLSMMKWYGWETDSISWDIMTMSPDTRHTRNAAYCTKISQISWIPY